MSIEQVQEQSPIIKTSPAPLQDNGVTSIDLNKAA